MALVSKNNHNDKYHSNNKKSMNNIRDKATELSSLNSSTLQ